MELIILHSLCGFTYDNVGPAVLNGYDIMSSICAVFQILSERLNLKRSIAGLFDGKHRATFCRQSTNVTVRF